jgi:hypothetical protein
MAYGTGAKIEYTDYNTIQQAVYGVLYTKYGQTPQTVTLNGGTGQVTDTTSNTLTSIIRYQQWNALQNDINALNYHLLGTLPVYNSTGLTTATKTTKISNSDRAAYLAVANALTSSSSVTVGGVTYPGYYSTPASGQNTLYTLSSLSVSGIPNQSIRTHTVSLTFPSSAGAQYFFNSGATIQFTASYTGGGTTLDADWTTLINGIGTTSMSLNGTTSTGSGSASGSIGFNQLTSSSQTLYDKTIGVPTYANDQYLIQATFSGSTLTLTIKFYNNYTSTGTPGYGVTFAVDGTFTSTVKTLYATGSYVSSQAYFPSITASFS